MQKTIVPIIVWLGFDPFRPVHNHKAAVSISQDTKTRQSTRHLTRWHSPQTPTAPQRQTRRGKTLLFSDASRTKNFEPSLNLNMGQEVTKTLKTSPLAHVFLTSVAQMVENTVLK